MIESGAFGHHQHLVLLELSFFSLAIIGCSKQSQAVDLAALIQAQQLNFTASHQLITRKGKYYKLQE